MKTPSALIRARLLASTAAAAAVMGLASGCAATDPTPPEPSTSSTAALPTAVAPQTAALIDAVRHQFPAISTVSAMRPTDPDPAHRQGRAVDFMIPNSATPAGIALGNAVAEYVWRSDPRWHVDYVLWRRAYRDGPTKSVPMEDRGSPTANHETHVHVTLSPRGPASL